MDDYYREIVNMINTRPYHSESVKTYIIEMFTDVLFSICDNRALYLDFQTVISEHRI